VVKVALRSRESMAALRPYNGVLLLQMMLWPEAIRDGSQFAPDEDVSVRSQEIAMAESYIDTLSGDFDPGQYTDEYKAALEELVEAKAAGQEVVGEAPPRQPAEVVDLMEALRQSVARAKEQRADAEPATRSATTDRKAPARKTAAQATAEKAGAEKAGAEKTSAKRTTKKAAAAQSTGSEPAKKTAAAKKTTSRTRRSA